MTLQDLFKSTDFNGFWPILCDTYLKGDPLEAKEYTIEDKERLKKEYKGCYDKLCEMTPKDTLKDGVLTVIKLYDVDYDTMSETPFMDVSAYLPEGDDFYGIEFTDWENLVGCEVCELSLSEYGTKECLAHLLWEITFCGFEPSDITEKREEIEKTLDEVSEGGTEEGKPWREVMNELGLDTEENEEERKKEFEIMKGLGKKNMSEKERFKNSIINA